MLKTKQAVIFGTGSFSEVVTFILEHDSEYEVVGYTASKTAIKDSKYLNKPLVAFEDIENHFHPNRYELFIAIGYAKMNRVRQAFMEEAKRKGYTLLSYISTRAQHWGDTKIGENVFIFEYNNIQPFVSIGDGTVLWSGNHIGHHATIGKYCFVTSHVVISGHSVIGDCSFLGVNSTIIDNIKIADRNLIGAGALITQSTNSDEVYIDEKAQVLKGKSERFFK